MGAKNQFDTNHVVTITLASLADEAFATSSAIDNSVDRFIGADVQLKYRTTTVSTGSDMPTVALFLIRSVDGGTTYDDADDNATLLDVYESAQDNTTFIYSTDTAQNMGCLPEFFKFVVKNQTGNSFDATGTNFSLVFTGKANTPTGNFV